MPKALVIDDDPKTMALLTAPATPPMVADESLTFVFCKSDTEALQALREEADIDIALVSIDSQAITGMGLFKMLEGVRLRIPRIALTDADDLSDIRNAMNDGAADFLVKPLSFDDLITTVGRVYADTERRRHAWKTEAQLAALKKELDIAGNIQQAILPNLFPVHDAIDLFAEVRPARDMSGDFYDFFELSDDALFLVVADVAGKGIPAAFYMAVARTLIRATALAGASPKACLEQVNTALCRHEISGMFVSVFLGHLDLKTWTLSYANGGHLPPLLRRAASDTVEMLTDGGDGVVLGVQEPMVYDQGQCRILDGDSLLIYTDGVTEAFDTSRTQYSVERLIDQLSTNTELSAAEIVEALFSDINTFVQDAPKSDDITAMVIQRRRNG